MPGFPTRPDRSAFGPTIEEERPVTNPKKEIGANTFNLDYWQVAGMGKVVSRVKLAASYNGATMDVDYQGLAWDPKGVVPDLVVTRTGAGIYTVDFAATYDDEQENPIAVALQFPTAKALPALASTGPWHANAVLLSAVQVEVRLWNGSGAGVPIVPAAQADERFLLEVM